MKRTRQRRQWYRSGAMRNRRRVPIPFALAVVLVVLTPALPHLQGDPSADQFAVRDVMIPMRDGVKLHTKIYTPKNQAAPLPMIMKRTPYGIEGSAGNFVSYLKALAEEGYIFVFQDLRGKFGSEGTFVMQRPPARPGQSLAARRGHGHLRHHRVAAEERAAQQRPRRHARHLLRRLDDDHGGARAAPGAEGDLAAGVAGRHVAR